LCETLLPREGGREGRETARRGMRRAQAPIMASEEFDSHGELNRSFWPLAGPNAGGRSITGQGTSGACWLGIVR
jgi:hypothetical protein